MTSNFITTMIIRMDEMNLPDDWSDVYECPEDWLDARMLAIITFAETLGLKVETYINTPT